MTQAHAMNSNKGKEKDENFFVHCRIDYIFCGPPHLRPPNPKRYAYLLRPPSEYAIALGFSPRFCYLSSGQSFLKKICFAHLQFLICSMIGWTAETIKTGDAPHDYSLRGPERYLLFTIFFLDIVIFVRLFRVQTSIDFIYSHQFRILSLPLSSK